MFTMGAYEQLKLDVIVKVSSGLLDRQKALAILDISERTFWRYLRQYRENGALFVKHGNYKKEPANKIPEDLKKIVLKLVCEKYFDFNILHCLEKLKSEENILVKRETFRKWCHEIKMVKRSKRRRPKSRYYRQRMKQTGLMLQMDGSHHRWFGNKESCLIAAIDDASNEVPFAEFFPSEDTLSCMRVIQKIIEQKGLFHILYVDKAGCYGGTAKRENFAQMKRACSELGIHVIFANSAEAKGRIERLFGTLQDRVVPEMRLRKISSYPAANSFLQEQFIPNDYDKKFTVTPANLQTAYRPLPNNIDLNQIFCLKEYRFVKRDHTIVWGNDFYQLISPIKYSIYNQQIELRTYQDLSWKAFFAGKEIKLTLVQKLKKVA